MNHKTLSSALALICALNLPEGRALAASPQDRSEIYDLGEIVVSAPGEGVQASETMRTVTAEEIQSRGARTLDQAIALLPGVSIRNGAEGVPRIDIRGFRTRHVLLLLDGIPMNSSFDQQFDPTSISTENIAEIKVTSGASSILYGQGGLGGVINIVTKKGAKRTQAMVGVETGDHEPYQARASLSGASDRYNYFLSGNAQQVDAFPLAGDYQPTAEQGSGYRKNSDRTRNNLLGTLAFTPNQDLALGLTVNFAQGSFGRPSSVVADTVTDPFASTLKYQRVPQYSTASVQLAAEYAAARQLSLRGWTWFTRHEERQNQYDSGLYLTSDAASSFRQRMETSIAGATLQPKYDFGSAGTLALSLSGESDSWENHGTQGGQPLSASKDLQLYSAGLEYEVTPLPGLGLVAGYGHYWQNRDEMNQDDYSLLFGVKYDLFPKTRLKASFKRNVRFPALGDLYEPGKGNALLNAEHSYGYEAGVEQSLPLETSISGTGFYTTVRNLIQTDQDSGLKQNLADVRFSGAELVVVNRAVKSLLVRGSYTHLHSEDRSRAGRNEQQYTPEHVLALESKYDFDCGLTPYASLQYVGNQYFYTKNAVTPVQKSKLNDYTLVNLKLSQRLLSGRASIYVGADNLFDQNYETSYGFPQAGRFIYGGVEFRQ